MLGYLDLPFPRDLQFSEDQVHCDPRMKEQASYGSTCVGFTNLGSSPRSPACVLLSLPRLTLPASALAQSRVPGAEET